MCGRFSLTVQEKQIEDLFGVEVGMYIPRYNCAPTQMLAVISNEEPGKLSYFRWGLIPSWARDKSIGNKLINARGETIDQKPSFRTAFQRRRCLIPADGFYEWKKLDARNKQPCRIVMKNLQPFAMAGIWDQWKDPDGEMIRTFSIITTAPNEIMKDIHNRMPVILHPDHHSAWLNTESATQLQDLLKPYPDEEMKAYPISKLVNSPINDIPEILEEVAWP